MHKKTKIGATLGPACESQEKITSMVKSGLDFVRLNFSHGTYENHKMLIKNVRAVEEKLQTPITIMQDIQGPKIRLGILPKDIKLKEGEEIFLDTSLLETNKEVIPIACPELASSLENGDRILLDDGHVCLLVQSVNGSKIKAKVLEGGVISSRKGINLPDSSLDIKILSDKDKKDLKFGVENGVDVVALSFVKSSQDVLDARFLLKKYTKELKKEEDPEIKLIAKIERHEAVDNIDEILEVVDGVMIARGDLGLELQASQVPIVQKNIIQKANALAKPVIVATQMLDSMKEKTRPTRAEVSDVANAVIDHADGLLLTNETAVGKHPVLTVKMMNDIIMTTEKSVYDDSPLPAVRKHEEIDSSITDVSRILAEEVDAKLILAASISGDTGRLLSHVRPEVSIYVATNTNRVWRQLNLMWGVSPFILPECSSIEELVERSVDYLKKQKAVKKGDRMIIVAGEPVGRAGNVNLVEVREVE